MDNYLDSVNGLNSVVLADVLILKPEQNGMTGMSDQSF